MRGGSAFGIYPFSRYRRVELSAGLVQLDEQYNDPTLQQQSQAVSAGALRPGGAPQRHADAARRRVHPGDDDLPRVRSAGRQHDAAGVRRRAEDRQPALAPDVRWRRALLPAASARPACWRLRIRGFKSFGDFPDFQYFGGNSELRGYDYLQFAGQNIVFANAELRFPLIEAALTPIGVIGGVRGVFFAGIGGAWFSNSPSANPCTGETTGFKFATNQRGHLSGADRLQDRRARRIRSSRPTRRPASRRYVLNYARSRSPGSACRTAARRTASGSRPSRSASRSTSTGRGAR